MRFMFFYMLSMNLIIMLDNWLKSFPSLFSGSGADAILPDFKISAYESDLFSSSLIFFIMNFTNVLGLILFYCNLFGPLSWK